MPLMTIVNFFMYWGACILALWLQLYILYPYLDDECYDVFEDTIM
jgi:hypothetical protein